MTSLKPRLFMSSCSMRPLSFDTGDRARREVATLAVVVAVVLDAVHVLLHDLLALACASKKKRRDWTHSELEVRQQL